MKKSGEEKGDYCMNKKKMGRFLRKLRMERGYSIEKLANEFSKAYLDISINTISKWENGRSIPDIENLRFLSEFFVVSIDEILDGDKYLDIDFEAKYFVCNPDWDKDVDSGSIGVMFSEQCLLISKTTNDLLKKYLDDSISANEYRELSFLLKTFYIAVSPFNWMEIFKQMTLMKNNNLSVEEKYWEIKKRIDLLPQFRLTYNDVSYEQFKNEDIQKRFANLDDWEKDYFVSVMQVENPIFNLNEFGSKTLEWYEEQHGKQYDLNQICKDTLMFFIQNGGMLNTSFFGYHTCEYQHVRIINEAEKNFDISKKPFVVRHNKEDGRNEYYLVENNENNRFIRDRYNGLILPLTKAGVSMEEIQLLRYDDHLPDNVIIKLAKSKNIDTNRDIQYIKADLAFEIRMIESEMHKDKHFEGEKIIDDEYFNESNLKSLREDGTKEFDSFTMFTGYEGGLNHDDRYEYFRKVIRNMSYERYLESRNYERTKILLANFDRLSFDEIRQSFYQIGGPEDHAKQ